MSVASASLVQRYNVPGPRYTSYPTVPYWEDAELDSDVWLEHARRCFQRSNASEGISLYVHLPFCETPCTFCGCIKKFTRDHSLEAPYIEDVSREWALYVERFGATPRLRELHIGGGTPTFFSAHHLSQLMSAILQHAEVAVPYDFSFEGNPSSTSEEHLLVMRDHGFSRLSLGVQDFDPHVQQTINRVQPFELVARVTESARRVGYSSINFDLIYGLPRQSTVSLRNTLRKVIGLRPDRVAFYGYAHVPWLPEASQRRFSEDEIPRGERKQALYDLGREMLMDAGYLQIGMDHFALADDALAQSLHDGSLHRNFMGYTPLHTSLMVGLGMSAISDAWSAFAQNEKKLSAYHERIAAGDLAVFRGHRLSREDRILRGLILAIMCQGEARLGPDFHALEGADQCIARLDGPLEDELVALDDDIVRVTDAGRPYLRNICMAFDARLWRDRPQQVMFSDTV